MARQRWTRESFIQAVRARYAVGLSMSTAWSGISVVRRLALTAAVITPTNHDTNQKQKCQTAGRTKDVA
tara:strand:+ start:1060 stop:1266 length:207 start_codon:yes stop_codon:yes gene_type:complete